ncbi:MAG: leucyl aminopeptidase [Candidatus Heimdallarchaeota archaeon]|nr:leucyl aminopeptidase [Candidatus Heimdallarchaeota archaeon]
MELNSTSTNIEDIECDGIILWNYSDQQSSSLERFGDKVSSYFDAANFQGKDKQNCSLFNIEGIKASRLVVVGVGTKQKANHEIVRNAVANAAKILQGLHCKHIAIEAVNLDAQTTAEGLILGLYVFDELKSKKDDESKIEKITFTGTDDQIREWKNGCIISESQNVTRRLAELPANVGTPSYFVSETKSLFKDLENTQVIDRDENWAKKQKMGAFLSVAAGTDEPAKFLEIHYKGSNEDDKPVVFVGKGITFDTGGISLKSPAGMGLMRSDCTGAATVIGTLFGIAKLGLKANIIGLTPLTENMPSGKATKPSDVVYASNGKSIEVDNTDAEGRMVLSDGLVYAESFNPDTIVDIATLTGSMMVALGDAFTGTYSRSTELWNELETAGLETFERFWRMPLDKMYKKKLKSRLADMKNVGGRAGGANIAAMFLSEFVTIERWAHLDIAGNMETKKSGYFPEGSPGIPVRALIQFVRNLTR